MAHVTTTTAAGSKLYDVLIVGGGPAGLSMAVGLARQVYSALVLDSGEYRNARAEHMHTVPGFDHASPASFRDKIRRDLRERYASIEFRSATVTRLRKFEAPVALAGSSSSSSSSSSRPHQRSGVAANATDGSASDGKDTAATSGGKQKQWLFEATDAQGNVYTGRKLALGTGVRDVFPEEDVPGYGECWGRGIFHCMFCHGFEERGAESAGVLAGGIMASPEMLAHVTPMVKRLAHSVTVYTNGDEELAAATREKLRSSKIRFDTRRIARVAMAHPRHQHQEQQQQQQEQIHQQGDGSSSDAAAGSSSSSTAVTLYFADGTSATEGFVANHPAVEQRASDLVAGLGLQMGAAGEVRVRAGSMGYEAEGVDGCFVAGDMATPMRSVAKALEMGTFAAAGMVAAMNAELDARDEL
ncbi:hypothetical protein JDV02_000600 [Purpureocillium takamizusanense]|uniref:FAD/NAD(P)-binding domain-containing protein n=1 Tax=Purpureocillium takamizusanense TaxID=2060973 RepID=A0A9Q8Q6F2_9HYPO|nr:uncharacterized protein JDV02_000600 [Purpureocillium takamizusanense]UNI13905.1 hypothetical protein JDV02_000600 [Purpureocillium takamizusanense]